MPSAWSVFVYMASGSGWFCTEIQIAQRVMQIYSTGPDKGQHTEFHLCGIFKGIFCLCMCTSRFLQTITSNTVAVPHTTVDMLSDGKTYYLIQIILFYLVLQYIPCDWLIIITSHMTDFFSWPKYILNIWCKQRS